MLQERDGKRLFGLPEDLRPELPVPSSGRLEANLMFSEHTVIHADDYLEAVGLSHLDGSGQRCYEFHTPGGVVVVPGQLLVVALVGVTGLMRAPLLTPQGPTALMTAFCDHELVFHLTPHRMRKFQIDRAQAVNRMKWILTYPSGARAWSSVYVRAIEGQLDIALPAARSRVALRGIQTQGKLWVTSLDLLTLEPTEEAHEFASSFHQPGICWTLSALRGVATLATTTQAANICPKMTDSQWDAVTAQLSGQCNWTKRKQRKHCVRSRLETIRLHLFSGHSFYRLPVAPSLREACRSLSKRLKKRGVWDLVESTLRSTL